jgi:hypothetical protein
MRHLFWRLGAREVLLLPPLVIGPSRRAVLVLRPGPLHPLPPGHWRARRAVDVAPVTGAADPYRHPAPRAREPSRLGRRHRPGVPRALHLRRFARSSTWFTVDRATAAAVTRRPGRSPGPPPSQDTPLRLPQLRPSRQLLPVTFGGSLLTSTPLAFLASVEGLLRQSRAERLEIVQIGRGNRIHPRPVECAILVRDEVAESRAELRRSPSSSGTTPCATRAEKTSL